MKPEEKKPTASKELWGFAKHKDINHQIKIIMKVSKQNLPTQSHLSFLYPSILWIFLFIPQGLKNPYTKACPLNN